MKPTIALLILTTLCAGCVTVRYESDEAKLNAKFQAVAERQNAIVKAIEVELRKASAATTKTAARLEELKAKIGDVEIKLAPFFPEEGSTR